MGAITRLLVNQICGSFKKWTSEGREFDKTGCAGFSNKLTSVTLQLTESPKPDPAKGDPSEKDENYGKSKR